MTRNLYAEREIYRAMVRYARAIDTRNWALLDSVFTEDVQGIIGGTASPPGRAAMIAGMRSHLDGCGPSQHLIGNAEIDIQGDEGRSRANVRACHIGQGAKADRSFEAFGEYDVHWRLTQDGWRAYRWELKMAMTLGDPSIFGPGR